MCLFSLNNYSQAKNFIDQPYLETKATVDSLVKPDRIYLSILIAEKDTRGRVSIEELENKMGSSLKSLGIDMNKQLSLADLGSNFRHYFLRKKDIQKSKSYQLMLFDGVTASKVIMALESVGISNVKLKKTEFSKIEDLKLALRKKAILRAKSQAINLTKPLDQKLGSVLYISDLDTKIANLLQGRVGGVSIYGSVGASPELKYKPLKIEFEEIKVESSIIVKFALN